MIVIGVTGGIGAGKTTVSGILKELGAVVLDADRISKEVTEPHKPAWAEIRKVFGPGVFKGDGTLDRQKLARIVFSSEEKKQELERIIHKEVISVIDETIRSMRASGFDGVLVLDVPIPVKRGFLDNVDRVWVVTSDDETRIRRVMERSGISREDAIKRINSQLTQDEYKKLAHETIENNGSPEELKEKVKTLYDSLNCHPSLH
ncbi:MAG TPA: dephospho-CoA kinase [Clostridiaceae bacterium]|nr:dephospho-CoA kinase [Clostridiaceae bacterium]